MHANEYRCPLDLVFAACHHGGVALFHFTPDWACYCRGLSWKDFREDHHG